MPEKKTPYLLLLYIGLFAISGFAGLIYESIWSQYLKLFLGHAALAQSLVLMIFMGGMALGAYLASRISERSKSPLLLYAGAEALIGVAAIVFHPLYLGIVDGVYNIVLPAAGTPLLGSIAKWSIAAGMILPQSILLGATFPLMAAGILRRFDAAPGHRLAILYFANSLGAAIGVLVAGFVLIRAVGLPGTISLAGVINIFLALCVWALVRSDRSTVPSRTREDTTRVMPTGTATWFMLAAFVTGAASFIYEIGWIRMLSLVLGATTHSFELMLSAFITGLALGGLFIRNHIDRIRDPVRFAGYVQVLMGLLAIGTLPLYTLSFGWMSAMLDGLARTATGYSLFTFTSHTIALCIMLPATVAAGMTLPLFTHVLLQTQNDEKSIGQIYAANTVGAICGVVFALHVGLPFLGLKFLIGAGALLDIVLGLALLYVAGRRLSPAWFATGAACLALWIGVLAGVEFRKELLTSGVYRFGNLAAVDARDVVFYRDGKTASTALVRSDNGVLSLRTNGKSDAGIQMVPGREPSDDEITMIMLGALPLAYHSDPKLIANIGMGSGLTTHTVLADGNVERVDTIEIEAGMVEASKGFGAEVARAHDDPRSVIHIADAKAYFAFHDSRYDIIISEPSNPWVSGVAALFSVEFYAHVKRYLHDDGLFVQWLQLYEFNDGLVASVLSALSSNFDDFALYQTADSDVLIVAKANGRLPAPRFERILTGEIGALLREVAVNSPEDLRVRYVGGRTLVRGIAQRFGAPANSDFFPYVDLNAPQARFGAQRALIFAQWGLSSLPYSQMLDPLPSGTSSDLSENALQKTTRSRIALRSLAALRSGDLDAVEEDDAELALALHRLTRAATQCTMDLNDERYSGALRTVTRLTLAFLQPADAGALLDAIAPQQCYPLDNATTAATFEFYRALALRDGKRIPTQARRLLALTGEALQEHRQQAIAALVLAHLSRDEYVEAIQAVEEHTVVYGQSVAQGRVPLEVAIAYALLRRHEMR